MKLNPIVMTIFALIALFVGVVAHDSSWLAAAFIISVLQAAGACKEWK